MKKTVNPSKLSFAKFLREGVGREI